MNEKEAKKIEHHFVNKEFIDSFKNIKPLKPYQLIELQSMNDDKCFHECPNCNFRCNCSNQPCSCCEN